MTGEIARDTVGVLPGKTGMEREMKIYRTVIGLLLVLTVVVFFGMFGAVYLAVDVSKEMQVSHSEVTDTNGQKVSTLAKHDSVQGVRREGRRLSSGDSGSSAPASVPATVFYDMQAKYAQGESEWIVPMGDGSAYTVVIKGWSARAAWGKCATCGTDAMWTVSCPVDKTAANSGVMCPVTVRESEAHERRLSHESDEDGEDEVFDRSLREKNCW